MYFFIPCECFLLLNKRKQKLVDVKFLLKKNLKSRLIAENGSFIATIVYKANKCLEI
jgi:hypothetical protein